MSWPKNQDMHVANWAPSEVLMGGIMLNPLMTELNPLMAELGMDQTDQIDTHNPESID